MTRLLIGGLIAAAFVASVPAAAQVAPGPSNPPRAERPAKSRADVQAAVARRFTRMDANRDGFITQAEADALRAARGERIRQRADKRASRRGPATMFARLDANKDGNITRAEADSARSARMVARGKPAKAHAMAPGGLFDRADSNRDGRISRAELDAAPPRAGKRGDMRHAGMRHGVGGRLLGMGDADKDGRVSLAEAQQAALTRFDRWDLNRDGQVTRDERRQAREQRRAQRRPG